jgi:integrase
VSKYDFKVRWLMADQLDPERSVSISSLRVKFLRFMFDQLQHGTDLFPCFPVKLATIMAYALWMNEHGINGFSSIAVYISALISWSRERGFENPTDLSAQHVAAWDKFKRRFKTDVTVHARREKKLRIQAGMLEALALLTDLNDYQSVMFQTAFVLLYFGGMRVGHVAAKRATLARHCVTWGDVIADANGVFLWLHGTKTRPINADDGVWQTVAARPQGHPALDPIRLLQRWFDLGAAAGGAIDPLQPLFHAKGKPMLPLSRLEFTNSLRAKLTAAFRLLPDTDGITMDRFSGVSFRKATNSALWGRIPRHRIAEHVAHADPSAGARYGQDTLAERAQNTHVIASEFAPGF